MSDHERETNIHCPHCDGEQDIDAEYVVAHNKIVGSGKTTLKCQICREDFFVQPIHDITYNTWHGRKDFYP